MKFSFEVPIHSIDKFTEEQDYLFILAHHLDNKKYFDYCKKSKKYKILDNGCYELGESIDPDKLISLAITIGADTIIIPDKLFDKRRSEELYKLFLEKVKPFRERFLLMKVVCGNNVKEYLESLKEIVRDKNVDIIGLSQSRTMIVPSLSYCMTKLKQYSKSKKNKPVHLLGLTSPYELIEAKEWSQIHTIDTGRAINFAFHKKKFPEMTKAIDYVKLSGYDIDTKRKLDVNLAKENIKKLKSYYK
jgi:hypothetical protein